MKYVVIISALVITSGVVITAVVLTPNNGIKVTLLENAGTMIEYDDTRIYIDPFDLSSSYSNYPADAILITHEHGDHYDPTSIDIIQKVDVDEEEKIEAVHEINIDEDKKHLVEPKNGGENE